MILIDKPYVSDYLKNTIIEGKIRVVKTEIAQELFPDAGDLFIEEKDAIANLKNNPNERIYTNSENSISWIEQNLKFLELPKKIKLFKNKVKLRDLLKPIFPNYYYAGVPLSELKDYDLNSVKFPIIIKPGIGFFSMGVHKIENKSEWNSIIKKIKVEMEEIKNIYPKEVMDSTDFILEELIEGEEYAIDCYFDAQSKPVVVNILHHIFSSGADMSDRVYTASAKIIRENLDRMTEFLEKMGELTKVKNYPTHVEVRVTQSGEVIPIEANPTRFGGWCSSPDLARYSLDINIVHYFLNNQKPDWYKILQGKEDKVYSIVILDNSTGYKNEQIESFDYDKLLNHFSNPLELRKINYHEYPVFGFVFCETPQDEMDEIWDILKSDLKEFVILKNDKS